jgi:hypothetical protein
LIVLLLLPPERETFESIIVWISPLNSLVSCFVFQVLKRTNRSQAIELLHNCIPLMLKEDNYFVVRSIVVLLGVLGRRRNDPEVSTALNTQHSTLNI